MGELNLLFLLINAANGDFFGAGFLNTFGAAGCSLGVSALSLGVIGCSSGEVFSVSSDMVVCFAPRRSSEARLTRLVAKGNRSNKPDWDKGT